MLKSSFIIKISYIILLAIIIIGTSFFEKSAIVARHDVNYTLPNIVFYAFALFVCILLLLWRNTKKYILIIPILLSCLSFVIALWFPVDLGADFLYTHKYAILFPEVFLKEEDILRHFQTFPFQINDATIYGIIYKFTGFWRSAIYLGTLSIITASFLSANIVYRITLSPQYAIICLTLTLCLCALNPRCFIPYSDNIGMPLICLILLFYSTKSENKWLFIFITTGIGYFIKPTVVIPTIAIVFIEIYHIKHISRKPNITNIKGAILGIVIMIMTISILPQTVQKFVHFTPNPQLQLGMSYFFFLGQNTATLGSVNGNDMKEIQSFNPQEKTKKTLYQSLQRIKERKTVQNIIFYCKKIIISHKDGLFNYPYRIFVNQEEISQKENDFWGQIIIHNGRYFQYYVGFMQITWNTMLILMLMGSVFMCGMNPHTKMISVLQLTILGVITYTLLFENRAKYLFMFLPIYGILSSLSLHYIHLFLVRKVKIINRSI